MAQHYPYLLDPRLYPEYTRRSVRAPTWETFENRTQFYTLRELHQTQWREDLDLYTQKFKLGRVIWPISHFLYAPHVEEAVAELRRRKLYLFDLWSYVPGSGMEGLWSNITPPPGMVDHLTRVLGDRFLGMDNGEQDGRYIGGYALQQCPGYLLRPAQYLNFHRHFQKLTDDLGNHMSALVSLCFGHYFVKEGNHVLLGAETAQALPNSQVYYAFIRGACKQYGIHWFGNASVFNRWGWKSYDPQPAEHGGSQERAGPESGTSLSLLKRLIYTHYLYNCVAVGFEQSWLMKNEQEQLMLSPIGVIQREAMDFVEKYGQPGVMHTPVALMLDFYSGWAMPRHLYTNRVYQVWGAMPYDEGDYLTHAVLSLVYPGYVDSSYYHDERGFISPTPYGDMADALLSDAPLWVMRQYGLIITAGRLSEELELRDKLRAFVEEGGELVVTAGNARDLVPGLTLSAQPQRIASGAIIEWANGARDCEAHAFDLYPATLPAQAEVQASCDGHPVVVRVSSGKGAYILLFSPFGINAEPLVTGPIKNTADEPLDCPYRLLEHARRMLSMVLAKQQLFTVGEDLGFITCRKGMGQYRLGVCNNHLQAKPFKITALCGDVRSLVELSLGQGEKNKPGYWPAGFTANDGGTSDDRTIAGGDIRMFDVIVEEKDVICLPRVTPSPRPQGRMLTLRGPGTIQEQILARPTFFQHFDGVKVDWLYFHVRSREQIEREYGWLERQQIRLVVDFSHRLNFYPDLCFINNYPPQYERSMRIFDDVLEKMVLLNAKDAVLTLQRRPENHCSAGRARDLTLEGMRVLPQHARQHGVTLHLQHHPARHYDGSAGSLKVTAAMYLEFLNLLGEEDLRFALNVGHAAITGEPLAEILAAAVGRLGIILLCAPAKDIFGQLYDAHRPLVGSGLDLSALASCRAAPQILDAVYASADEEHLDYRMVWEYRGGAKT